MRAGSSQANPVRVLHVFGGLGVGGAEVRTMDIYHAIDKTKVQFDFISHKPNEDYFENEIRALGGRIYHVPRYRLHNRAAYQRAWSEFLDAHPYYDTVHIHTTNTAAAILPILARHGVRQRITHAHSSSNPSAAKHILLRMNRNTINRLATVRLAVSADAAAYVYGRAAAGPGGVAIVQDAIDAKKYVFNPDTRAAVRESLSLRDSFVIGHVGRFAEVKNHGFLLDVFSEVAGKRPNARLVLVGDGTLRGAMADKAEQLGLSGRVAFLGVRDDVPSLMQAFDALVLPSHYEGLPGVTTEAQAAGLPCLISDRVTRECDIVPNLCTFLPIGQGTAPWVDAITGLESAAHDMVRRNTCAEIAAAGFDSGRQAQNYAKMYLEKENGSTWTAF